MPLILCYHKIERRREIGVTRLSPDRFARQIEHLARAGWRTVTMREVEQSAEGRRVAGDHELLITFDDAYRGLREWAFPVLDSVGFTATCAVITDYAGRLNRWDVALGGRRFPHLTWRDIERWAARGITFVSHTATHPRLTWIPDRAVRTELVRSRDALAAALGAPPQAVCYPFGAARTREHTIARDEGYTMGFMLAAPWNGDAMAIPRTAIYPWTSLPPRTNISARAEHAVARVVSQCSIAASAWRALV